MFNIKGGNSSRESNESATSRFSRWFSQKDVTVPQTDFQTLDERRDVRVTEQSNAKNNFGKSSDKNMRFRIIHAENHIYIFVYFLDLENRDGSSDNNSNSLLSFLKNNNLITGQGQGALPNSGKNRYKK